MSEGNVDTVVAKYVELRDRRSEIKAKYEAQDAELEELMEKIERWLKAKMDQLGLKTANTPHGTAYKIHKEYASVADWEEMLEYIRQHEAWGLLEKRVSKKTLKEIMSPDANGEYTQPPPPGVNFVREETVQVRRS